MVTVGECIAKASIRGLLVLSDPSVYIHSVGLCRGAIVLVVVGSGLGRGYVFCVGRSIWRSFAIVGGDVRGVLVVELSVLECCVDSRMSQESMLTSVVWPMM